MANAEAEEIAYLLSGELVSPIDLYERVLLDLKTIRKTWRDSVSYVDIKYMPYFPSSRISLGIRQSAFDSILNGLNYEWDSLNAFYGLEEIEYRDTPFDFVSVNLLFHGRLNPNRLVDIYSGIDGANYINPYLLAGDGSLLYPFTRQGKTKYFFRYAYGDCPAGCIYSEVHYFSMEGDSAHYQGYYIRNSDESIRPNWVDTLEMAIQEYSRINYWPPLE